MSEYTSGVHACIRCGESKPVEAFYVRKDTGKLKNTCKACCASWHRQYRESGPQRYGRYQKYNQPDGKRTCRLCSEPKDLDEFQARYGDGRPGKRNECKPCYRKLGRKRYASNPEKHRDTMRRSMYGLQSGEYDSMLEKQGEVCAICLNPETSSDGRTGKSRKLFVDHNHSTGAVRALLCMRCNIGIGQFRESPELLAKAIEYLNRYPPR